MRPPLVFDRSNAEELLAATGRALERIDRQAADGQGDAEVMVSDMSGTSVRTRDR
ncbi:hypothetical protein D9M71_597060 [compost metagenome]